MLLTTGHAIHIVGRAQNWAGMRGGKLSLALLDWEKAFGKLQHDKVMTRYRDVFSDCYGLQKIKIQMPELDKTVRFPLICLSL